VRSTDRRDGVPGVVASTFGGYGANWHPQVHALATEGLILPGGTFVPGPRHDGPARQEESLGHQRVDVPP
jgi:hypothetical protein